MTNNEAINILHLLVGQSKNEDEKKVLMMAIHALENETAGTCLDKGVIVVQDLFENAEGLEHDPMETAHTFESDVWGTFYMVFNDANLRHMSQAYGNNGLNYVSVDTLHQENVSWIIETINAGVPASKIDAMLPAELKIYLKEALAKAPDHSGSEITQNIRQQAEEYPFFLLDE